MVKRSWRQAEMANVGAQKCLKPSKYLKTKKTLYIEMKREAYKGSIKW